jgi:flagellar biosynthesis GTPase FlhF
MMRSRRVVLVMFACGFLLGFAGAGAATAAKNEAKKDKGTADKSGGAAPPGVTLNACGCYKKGNACACTSKKGKCECPGECEPVGCAEKRDKEMEKEAADAVKHAQDDEKKRAEAEAKQAQDEEKKRRAAEAAEEAKEAEAAKKEAAEAAKKEAAEATKKDEKKGDGVAEDQSDAPAEPDKSTGKGAKPARKGSGKK